MKQVPCPTCRQPTCLEDNPHRPFCSERCRLLDLGNWASDRYRIPGPPTDILPEGDAEDEDDGGK